MSKYFLDTSALIEFYKRAPSAWADEKIQEELKRGIKSKTYIIIRPVYNELINKRKNENDKGVDFEKWLEECKEYIVNDYYFKKEFNKISQTYLSFVNDRPKEFSSQMEMRILEKEADPYVISYAYAKRDNSDECGSVVSCETPTSRHKKIEDVLGVKMPNVCKKYGITHIALPEFLYIVMKVAYQIEEITQTGNQ